MLTEGRDIVIDEKMKLQLFQDSSWAWNHPVRTFSGTVVSDSQINRTHMSGDGSRYAPLALSSSSNTAFWVRRSDGEEQQFTTPSHCVSFRTGHEVTVLQGSETGAPIGVLNHSSQSWRRYTETPWLRIKSFIFFICAAATGLGLLIRWAMNNSKAPPTYMPKEYATHLAEQSDFSMMSIALFAVNVLLILMLWAVIRHRKMADKAFEQITTISRA